jgi:hypothetical protein
MPSLPFVVRPSSAGRTRSFGAIASYHRRRHAERIGLINWVVPADRLAAEVDALADPLAPTPPKVMDAAGFRMAVEAGLDLGAIINAADTPEQREWAEVVRRRRPQGGARLAGQAYDERLAGSDRGGVKHG